MVRWLLRLFGLPRMSVWLTWAGPNGHAYRKEFRVANPTTLDDFYRYRVPYAVSGIIEVWRNKELVLTVMKRWGLQDLRQDLLEPGDHLIFIATEDLPVEAKGPL
jgi:hypothetical protein